MPLFKTLREFLDLYEMPLARAFYEIDNRGVMVDPERLERFVARLDSKLVTSCQIIENEVKMKVVPRMEKGVKTPPGMLNLSSPPQLIKVINEVLKIKLKTSWDSGNQTSSEEALNEAFAKTGNVALKEILVARELSKLKGTYAETALVDDILYTSYGVANTVTGRRSARATIFTHSNGKKIGTNAQTIPKQSELGRDFRECLVARPGRIFVSADQVQAEDWIVSALIADNGGGTTGLEELRNRIDRHKKLASAIFRVPLEQCGKGTLYRFMGKKTRHAGNYDEGAGMMASTLVKEGFRAEDFYKSSQYITLTQYCEVLLNGFHTAEPGIRGTFHNYIQQQLRASRTLQTPIGRERYFFGLRPGADNSKLYKEAYSYIPQSTVGDNTGLGVLYCESTKPGWVVLDAHDAITLEVPDNQASIREAAELLEAAFDRELTLPNGTVVKIPIEYEVGYDLKNEIEFHNADKLSFCGIGWKPCLAGLTIG